MSLRKRWRYLILLAGIWISLNQLHGQEIPEKAICAVCATLHAHESVEAEKVKGWDTFDGQHYYFCSEECEERFAGDPVAYVPPVFPRPAPDISVRSLGGEDVDLGRYRGRVVLVDFWATWCAPCEKMMPELQKLHDTYSDQGFTVLGISIDEESEVAKKVSNFVSRKKIKYPVLLDVEADPAWAAFHVPAIPATYLIDRQEQIVAQWIGKFDQREAAAAVSRLLADSVEE